MKEVTNHISHSERVNIQSWSNDLLERVRPLAQKKQIHLYREIDGRIDELALEKSSMTELVQALLGSAIVTSPPSSSVGLELTGDARHDTVHLTIWDSGPGITHDDVMRMYLGEGLDTAYGDVLKAVPELVFKHEGLMTVNTSQGYGTRVTLSLPWQEPLLLLGKESTFQDQGCILLVDDDELNTFTISSYLRSLGFQVITAYNGWEGVNKLVDTPADLILMDVDMPIMSGLEAIRHIRSLGESQLSQIPIIVLSAYSMSSDQHDCLAAGANEFISKPVSMRWLRRKVRHYLPPNPSLS